VEVCHLGVPPLSRIVDDDRAAGPPTALIVGRMAGDERYKGHDPLLDIWRGVVEAVPGATLRIVGDGDDRARLEQKAVALGLSGHVTFVGPVGEETLHREYARCTAFVMPSRDEGFGFVFVEAMRAARACVGSRGAASEVIADGDTGVLVDPGQPAQLLQAVVQVLRDRAAADAMGARGRARYLQEFTEERFRTRFNALLPVAS
jgi:glycosyltransferase involved in cell wall biosynthesis